MLLFPYMFFMYSEYIFGVVVFCRYIYCTKVLGLNTNGLILADGKHSTRANLGVGAAAAECPTSTRARYSGCVVGGVNPHDGRGTPGP